MKTIGANPAGWPKYFGNSQSTATLQYGQDYIESNFEALGPESNYVIYYGSWRRPSDGDSFTENNSADWSIGANMSKNDYPSPQKVVNSYAIGAFITASPTGPFQLAYPSSKDAAWDFSGFTEFNTPNLNVYLNPGAINGSGASDWYVLLYTDASNWFYCKLEDWSGIDTWTHFSIPVGPFFNVQGNTTKYKWLKSGSPSWGNINWIEFGNSSVTNSDGLYVDGLHFGDAKICRVAQKSGASIYNMKTIIDNVGKDDSLQASNASGVMASLAYAELLRQQATSYTGYVITPILPEALPGQYFFLTGADFRATRITHTLSANGLLSKLYLTTDLLNSNTRHRYEDINRIYAAIRPQWQDRESSSLKSGEVDWRITRLVKSY
jgi:hypothetical protein